jgi:hypothetical protein
MTARAVRPRATHVPYGDPNQHLPRIESTLLAYPTLLPPEIRGSDSMNHQSSHPFALRKDRLENSYE